MTIDCVQFRDLISRTLVRADMHSKNAVELLVGTAAHESLFGTYLRQINGPARGFFQMEPDTETDIWNNYIRYRPRLGDIIARVSMVAVPSPWALETNIAYQILMARIHYLRVPHPLPYYKNIPEMAEYWDKYYNCNPDKGFPDQFVEAYRTLCG